MIGGGAERVVSILSEDLSGDFNIHLVLINGPVEYALSPQISVRFLRREPRWRLFRLLTLPLAYWRYRRFCQAHRIQISVSFDNLANYMNAALSWCRKWRGRIVLSERNPPSVQFSGSGLWRSIHCFLIRWLYPKHHALIPCSQGVGLDLQRHYGLSSERFSIIYNPLRVSGILKSAGENPDLRTGAFVFIHVGSFREQKNHHLLLTAFQQADLPDTELWLIGKGPLEDRIRQLAADLGILHKVRFLGFQANPYSFMARADCCVCTSHYEGFPNALLEALVCSLPIISVDCRYGPREILAPGTHYATALAQGIEIAEYGILTPVGDAEALVAAMRLIYAENELRLRFKKTALKRAHDFDHLKISGEYAGLLKKEAGHIIF